MKDCIYLDYASTSPVAPEVLEAMYPYFTHIFGNASSRSHAYGWQAKQAIETAKLAIANLLAVNSNQLTFTSGSTEAINLMIFGVAHKYKPENSHFITSAIEHPAVIACHEKLEKEGYAVSYLQPDEEGLISIDALENAITPKTKLVSIIWGNNETGVLQPIKKIAELCQKKKVLSFSDATQVVGKIPCHPAEIGLNGIAFSAHKFYGPKGVGGLWHQLKNEKINLKPILVGGGQEDGLRSGTLNVSGIVGMGAAAALAMQEMNDLSQSIKALRLALENSFLKNIPAVCINSQNAPRLPHISNISFRFIDAEALLSEIGRKVALSTGSACSSTDIAPSHVLLAMGVPEEDVKATLRFSFGRMNTEKEIQLAVEWISESVANLRKESPSWELFQDGVLN